MGKYSSHDIRNIALMGHADSGKTTFADVFLKTAGAVTRVGSVQDGTSVSDFDDEEHQRKNSIYSSVVRAPWKGQQIRIIDTPGYPDFIGEVITTLPAADVAVLCVSAVSGIGINTRRTWQVASDYNLPKAVLITKLDLDNQKYDEVLAQVQEIFGKNCITVIKPVDPGAGFKGVVNVLTTETDGHDELVEAIAETDDALMEKYLNEEKLSDDELKTTLAKAIAGGKIVPVLCCSSMKDIGVSEFLDFAVEYFPAPSQKNGLPVHKAGAPDEPAELPPLDGPFCGLVFKILTDPFVGKIAFFRVMSGSLDPTSFNIVRTGGRTRINGLFMPQGKEQEPIEHAIAGDIATVAKVEDIQLGDTLVAEGVKVEFGKYPLPTPMVSLAIFPKSRSDEQKISTALQKLADETPVFKYERERQTKELVVRGTSALHLDIVLSRLKRRYNVDVDTKVPDVPYLETITAAADGHHRHKKQTGGRGQFGEVFMRVEPNERGAGLEFIDETVGGSIPRNFIPAIEKGVRETMNNGVIAGHEIVDVKAFVTDGSFHAVDSDEASFKLAGARAFADAFSKARPVLLEPIVKFEITVPSRYMGDITSDLSGRRGRISDTGIVGDMQIIAGEIPLSETLTYSTELRSMTGGEGSYTIEFSHYDAVPARFQEQVVAKAQAKREQEKK